MSKHLLHPNPNSGDVESGKTFFVLILTIYLHAHKCKEDARTVWRSLIFCFSSLKDNAAYFLEYCVLNL